MNIIPTTEELKDRSHKEEKTPLWAPPPQHNFLKNWQRNLALRKKQQEVLSGEQRVRLPPDYGGCETQQAFFPSHVHPELGPTDIIGAAHFQMLLALKPQGSWNQSSVWGCQAPPTPELARGAALRFSRASEEASW